MLDRRSFLSAALGALALPAANTAAAARQHGLDAVAFGVVPGAPGLREAFARLLEAAAIEDMPVFLPPGDYALSGIVLPPRVRLSGVAGATRFVHDGDGAFVTGEELDHVELTGLVLDGGGRGLGDGARGLLDLRRVRHLAIDGCGVLASGGHGIALEQAAGRIERSAVSGAAEAGIYSVDAAGLRIAGNTVSDCGNGGILVHRWQAGEDGTLVTGNRVERIAARAGGTGQNGNGINIFRAGNVAVADNIVSDCAFSALRANGAGNVRLAGNTCLRSGETAVYVEFGFEGAVVTANIVDGAASGISIVNFNEGGRLAVCSANIVRNLTGIGPYRPDPPGFGSGIFVEADCAVTGNLVENAPLYGIGIGWGEFMRNVVATGNIICNAGCGIAVSVAEGVGAAVVTDNLIDRAERGAILGHRWGEFVTGDLALTDGDPGHPLLTVARNGVSP